MYHPNGKDGSDALAGIYMYFSAGVIARTDPESVGFFVVSRIGVFSGSVKNWVYTISQRGEMRFMRVGWIHDAGRASSVYHSGMYEKTHFSEIGIFTPERDRTEPLEAKKLHEEKIHSERVCVEFVLILVISVPGRILKKSIGSAMRGSSSDQNTHPVHETPVIVGTGGYTLSSSSFCV